MLHYCCAVYSDRMLDSFIADSQPLQTKTTNPYSQHCCSWLHGSYCRVEDREAMTLMCCSLINSGQCDQVRGSVKTRTTGEVGEISLRFLYLVLIQRQIPASEITQITYQGSFPVCKIAQLVRKRKSTAIHFGTNLSKFLLFGDWKFRISFGHLFIFYRISIYLEFRIYSSLFVVQCLTKA